MKLSNQKPKKDQCCKGGPQNAYTAPKDMKKVANKNKHIKK